MALRRIEPEELRSLKFGPGDVLTEKEDRMERHHDLKSAMAVTSTEHDEIGLIVMLADGEVVEIVSDMIEYEVDYIELRGSLTIPTRAIIRVEI